MSLIPTHHSPMVAYLNGVKVQDGYVTMPDLPGIGFEHKSDLFAQVRTMTD